MISTKIALAVDLSASFSGSATASFGASYSGNVSVGTEFRREWAEWRPVRSFNSELSIMPLQTDLEGSAKAEVPVFSSFYPELTTQIALQPTVTLGLGAIDLAPGVLSPVAVTEVALTLSPYIGLDVQLLRCTNPWDPYYQFYWGVRGQAAVKGLSFLLNRRCAGLGAGPGHRTKLDLFSGLTLLTPTQTSKCSWKSVC